MHANPLQRERSASLKFMGGDTQFPPMPAPCEAEAGREASAVSSAGDSGNCLAEKFKKL